MPPQSTCFGPLFIRSPILSVRLLSFLLEQPLCSEIKRTQSRAIPPVCGEPNSPIPHSDDPIDPKLKDRAARGKRERSIAISQLCCQHPPLGHPLAEVDVPDQNEKRRPDGAEDIVPATVARSQGLS
jgi:hypothetical protein